MTPVAVAEPALVTVEVNVRVSPGAAVVRSTSWVSARPALPSRVTPTASLTQPATAGAVHQSGSETLAVLSSVVSPSGRPAAAATIWKVRVAAWPAPRVARVQVSASPSTARVVPPAMLPGT